jgi:glycosyltransferase involved in cell wall biosynthesis
VAEAPLTIALLGDQDSVHIQRWSAGLAERGHDVIALDIAGRRRGPYRRVVDFLAIWRQIRVVLARPNALLAIHYVPDGVLATALRGLHPVVVSTWGDDVTSVHMTVAGRLRAGQLGGLIRSADARTATSHFLADVVRRRFGVESSVVPFGVDIDQFRPGERAGGSVLRIGFVKWLEYKYAADVLVEAFARLGTPARAELVIAGDGPMDAALRQQVADLGLAHRVTFLGRVPHAEVARLMPTFDIFAMPSRWEEFGVSAPEAGASGIPVVATAVGGVAEIIEDGVTGILVPPDDAQALAGALDRLLADPSLRQRMGRSARARIEREFDWERCLDQMEAVYRSVVGQPEP